MRRISRSEQARFCSAPHSRALVQLEQKGKRFRGTLGGKVMKRRGSGRPALPDHVKRKHYCSFMLTDSEAEQLKRAAALAGLRPGEYARARTLDAPLPRPPVPAVNVEEWRKLARLQANVNQLARRANEGMTVVVDPDLMRLVAHELKRLRLALLGIDTEDQGDDSEH